MSPTATQDYISSVRRLRQSMRTGEILIVDDDLGTLEYLGCLCKSLGEKSVTFKKMENAKWYMSVSYSCIKLAVLDYTIGNDTAEDLIELCREYHIPCIIHTGRYDLVPHLEREYPDIITILKASPIEKLIKELV